MRKNKWKGTLIIAEGLDGSGKTTALKNPLIKDLDSRYKTVYIKGVGSDTFWGKAAKRFPTAILFLAELAYVTYRFIIPALKEGKVVLLDKYFYVVASHIPEADKKLNKFFIRIFQPFLIHPDLIVYFQVSMEKRVERLKSGPPNKFHRKIIENPEWAAKKEKRYASMVRQSGSKVAFIDTTNLSKGSSAGFLRKTIEHYLKGRR